MRKPEFEQFRQATLRQAKALPQQQREPYRTGIVRLLEDTDLFLVQKARKDGHDDALLEIHGSWIGTEFSPEAVMQALRDLWPGKMFASGEVKHWIEAEAEIVTLEFAWNSGAGQFLTGRIKIVAS
ncbi:MAG TPA: hypothetical protein VHE55_08325 [Fimbriimonadaceae bacterium]|nr:hypothetical protein [Fimbriimonadaceae bacterium]